MIINIMSLKTLFTRIESTIFLNPNPQTKIKRLLESYNSNDWKDKVKHQKMWFDNPIIQNDTSREIKNIKTPVFFNESKYFDMYIIGFPPNYSTNIHDHTNKDCYIKVLDGELMEKRYNLSKLSHSQLLYNDSPVSTIGHIKNNVFHSVENLLDSPTYTLNIYSKH